jgi:polysaccharide chain length determinant protein (PEP-CTERM system associated)
MIPKKFDLDYYKAALLRRKWHVIVPFFLILISGTIYAVTKPKMYQASTVILVQRQQVPSSYVASNVTSSLMELINTIQQQVASRTNLEALIKSSGLYAGEDSSDQGATMQDKVERMRRNIQIQVQRAEGFTISFTGKNPRKVAEIANALASNFMTEHVRAREEMSTSTTQFLKSELARVKATLREKETALTAFKQQHMGGLPDDLDTNLRMMEQLNQKVSSIERRLDETHAQKNTLEQQILNLKNADMVQQGPDIYASDSDLFSLEGGTAASGQLQELRDRLKALRLTYTEKHPDIIRLEKMIKQIEEDQAQVEEDETQEMPPSGTEEAFDMAAVQRMTLETQRASLETITKDLLSQKAKLEKQISLLAKRIETTPQRQLALISLQREYNQIRSQYDSLAGKELQSELAENLEKRQQGEQFTIVDPATVPEKPFSPNVPRIMLMTLLAALCGGFGLGFTLEYFDQSFRGADDLAEFMQMPVLAIIPRLETAAMQVKRRRHRKVFAYCLSGSFLLAVCITIFLWVSGGLGGLLQKLRSLV